MLGREGGWHREQMITRTTLFLTVGLPGAGKTTMAKQLADERCILRLTPDEWMATAKRMVDATSLRVE